MSDSVLWVEKYRPASMKEYIFKDDALKQKMLEWLDSGEIPHIGFFGPPGTGKTSALQVLINELITRGHVDRSDVITMNMSEKGIDAVRDEIQAVASITPFGKYRIFVLEEMEEMGRKAQGSMKRIMEDYIDNARFIFTSNAPRKIIPALRSRVQIFTLDKHDRASYTGHIVDILMKEGISIETDDEQNRILKCINDTYPDFRSTLNTLQKSIVNGKILDIDSTGSTAEYRTMIIDALKTGSIRTMREIIVKNIPESDVEDFFTFLYQNVNLFTTDEIKEMRIYIAIRNAAVNSSLVADHEMNISAVLCEIDLICNDLQ